jgi:hypothetical protein
MTFLASSIIIIIILVLKTFTWSELTIIIFVVLIFEHSFRAFEVDLRAPTVAEKTIKMAHHPIQWRDSISRPITPCYSVAGGDDTIPPRRILTSL